MREELKPYINKHLKFIGEFIRYGDKSNYRNLDSKTMLFKNIKILNSDIVIDHFWAEVTNLMKRANLKEGSIILFSGMVRPYKKGLIKRGANNKKEKDITVKYINVLDIKKNGKGENYIEMIVRERSLLK